MSSRSNGVTKLLLWWRRIAWVGSAPACWAARGSTPTTLRALDHERRVQRAETIGSLLNSIVGVLVVVITGMDVLHDLGINVDASQLGFGVFGFLLVVMMVLRPEGLLPERRRKLH